jgi:hypothetical protein
MAKALLGDFSFEKSRFRQLGAVIKKFETSAFRQLNEKKRSMEVNRALCELIQKEAEPCFLLPAVLEFVERVDQKKILEAYTLNHFELWLNQFSELSFDENARIRGKIAGKWIPREEYQSLFPIGMGKVYEGTHFVTGHKSPDLDTTVASFWGWVDAFAARVTSGLHVWNLPGGPPSSQIEIDLIFRGFFGEAVFTHLARQRSSLHLTGNDLMTQKGLIQVSPKDSIASIDHERDHKTVIIVDPEGFYLGDWRNIDVEGVRQVVILLSDCIRWFENHLHLKLIALFTEKNLHLDRVAPILKKLFSLKVKDCEPGVRFSTKEMRNVGNFIVKVLGLKEGLDADLETLITHLSFFSGGALQGVQGVIQAMKPLFDSKGRLLENRPNIFRFLEEAIGSLHDGISKIRERLEQLDIALQTKQEVFEHRLTFVTVRSDVEEVRSKMGSYLSLTVASAEGGKFLPLGTIYASDLRRPTLGTVSLRDFCNPEEVGIPDYLEVISVIDHHKSELSTSTPPMALIADVQSCNTLVGKVACAINDRYSLGGQTPKKIDEQMARGVKNSERISWRLAKKREVAKVDSQFYVHPDREGIEYLHFLYAILDDTDLLSKVSIADLECVAGLLNRLKSLAMKKEAEVVNLSDLPRDSGFLKEARARILQNDDMYSLYKKVYAYREKMVEKNLALAAKKRPSVIFDDTKEQNGCCRVGQTKVFASNIDFFLKHADEIRRVWLEGAREVHSKRKEIVLHIHMISTIVSAEDVYRGKAGPQKHKDELWIWIPEEEIATECLKKFLNNFKNSPALKGNDLEVEFLGPNASGLSSIFSESFFEIPTQATNRKLPIAVVCYKAGSLNSRKAMVSPFLPT